MDELCPCSPDTYVILALVLFLTSYSDCLPAIFSGSLVSTLQGHFLYPRSRSRWQSDDARIFLGSLEWREKAMGLSVLEVDKRIRGQSVMSCEVR